MLSQNRFAIADIALIIGLFTLALWVPFAPRWLWIAGLAGGFTIAYPLLSNWRQKKTFDETGFRRHGLIPASWACLAVGVPVAAFLYWLLPEGPFRFYQHGMRFVVGPWVWEVKTFFQYSFVYLFLVITQQYIHMGFVFPRLYQLTGNNSTRAGMWGLVFFTLVHYPNPVLMVMSFMGGILFFTLFARYRNIIPLIILHWALGLLTYQLTFSYAPSLAVGHAYERTLARFDPISRLP